MKKIKLSLVRKIDLIFLFAIAVFAVLFFITFNSLQFSKESSKQVSHAQNVLYQLERITSGVVEIEASHRGFIISGNDSFLGTVDAAKMEIKDGIKTFRSLVEHKPNQIIKVDSLASLIDEKIISSEYGISLRRQDINQALLFVSSGKGKSIMDKIRRLSRELENEELATLNQRLIQNESSIIENYRNYLIVAFFALLLVFVFYVKIRQNTESLIRYKQEQDGLIKELNYQNKQLDDFAHITSHNIRSPANNISTLISLLNEKSTIEDYRSIYEKLTKVSNNLNETLTELIDVLHVKKQVGIEKQHLSFEDVFNKVKESLQGEIIKNGVLIYSDFSEAPYITYPKTYLESIFHNLISNAIKYRSAKVVPEVQVKSQIRNGIVELLVSDNGLGIDLNRHGSKVFGLRKVFHKHPQAKGIGLFMTRTQIETLGGKISVESEVDKGTTFTVHFNADHSQDTTIKNAAVV